MNEEKRWRRCRKSFQELSVTELYAILKARVDVFVVEQNCAYREIDGLDPISTHFFDLDETGAVTAYLRVIPEAEGAYRIGRVLTTRRGFGEGRSLLHEAMEYIHSRNERASVILDAQTYAVGFYEKEGFQVVSDPFDEDGIPHVKMEWNGRNHQIEIS